MYTEEYLSDLDKSIKMIPLTFDVAFKSVMLKNVDLFKEFLIKTMYLDLTEEDNYILFLDKELIKQHFKEHGKVVDMNIKIGKDLLINVELNTEKYSLVKRRNDLYLEKLDTLSFEVGESYQKLNNKYIYQLNLNSHKEENIHIGEKIIVPYDIKNHEVDDDRSKIFVKNLVFYRNKYYNDKKSSNFDEIFLASLTSRSFYEFYHIISHILSGERLKYLMESVMDMSKDEFVLHAWEKEKMDKMVQDNIKRDAFEEGNIEGIKQGIEQNKVDIIKSMLENNITYELISKVTGKSTEEIKEIEKSIKD